MNHPRKSLPVGRASLIGVLLCLTAGGNAALAATFELSNGPGDGSVTVGVDGFGAFGGAVGDDSTDAIFDPVGPIGPGGTTFHSGVFISGGPPSFLTSGSIGSTGGLSNPPISFVNGSATSSFTHGFLQFNLTQTLVESFDGAARVGSRLDQRYAIHNPQEVPVSFSLVRYLDGDLLFDGTISDGGGRLVVGANQILFETDAASGSEASATFVGITATGGTIPTTNRFEVSPYDALLDRINAGGPLGDEIVGDTDGDGFIDSPYDVTLALRNEFVIAPGDTEIYTTQTLFGNAVPPAPGSSEAVPLLPEDDEPPFIFDIDPDSGETIWIDPPVTSGYLYEITSGVNAFETVTLPSFATVPDPSYEIWLFDPIANDFILEGTVLAGASFNFGPGVTQFQIRDIDPLLGLDPADPLAFPVGIAFVDGNPVEVTMSPITTDVPEPASLLLLAGGILGLGAVSTVSARRRRDHRFVHYAG
ncbi:MAG: PEP-CTERM sorting domain-containing protein [Alphaproteobacteria bacterium]